jgi:DNA gyrase/topoisomerase IV subunit B
MTREKIANIYLLISALTEVLIDQITVINSTPLRMPTTHSKLKNLKAHFERNSKKIFEMIQDPDEQLQFFKICELVTVIFESAGDTAKLNRNIIIAILALKGEFVEVSDQKFNELTNETNI